MTTDLSSLIERIEAKCRGSGEIHVCCHPDVDDTPVTHGDRACVLDTGEGAPGCDIANDEKLKSKLDCPYWRGRPVVAPEPPTIDEALALCAAALKARNPPMKDEPTPEQIAMARRIHAEHDPDKAYQYLDGSRDDYPSVQATIAAIIETTRLASSMAADTLDKARAGEIDNDLRSIKHILVGRFVDGDHLQGQDHG